MASENWCTLLSQTIKNENSVIWSNSSLAWTRLENHNQTKKIITNKLYSKNLQADVLEQTWKYTKQV